MTLVRLIALIRFYKKTKLNVVMMGASGKVEQRLFCRTNYFEELTNFYPDMTLMFHIVGPELSPDIHGKTVKKNDRLQAKFYRGMTSEFLDSLPAKLSVNEDENTQAIIQALPLTETIFIGFNPGFGSGFEPLLHSWCLDLVRLTDLMYPVFFTQANDFSDLRGEQRVLEVIFEGKIKQVLQPEHNPFRAATHYTNEDSGKPNGQNVWCCANTHNYGLQGWVNKDDKLTRR